MAFSAPRPPPNSAESAAHADTGSDRSAADKYIPAPMPATDPARHIPSATAEPAPRENTIADPADPQRNQTPSFESDRSAARPPAYPEDKTKAPTHIHNPP